MAEPRPVEVRSRFFTWLYRIGINEAKRRAERHPPSGQTVSMEERPVHDTPDRRQAPPAQAEQLELRAALERAVRALPVEYRGPVILRDVEGLSTTKAAAVEGSWRPPSRVACTGDGWRCARRSTATSTTVVMRRPAFSGLRFVLDHRFTRAHAPDYLDGELDPAERRRVERHTSVCPKCRQALEAPAPDAHRASRAALRATGRRGRPGDRPSAPRPLRGRSGKP